MLYAGERVVATREVGVELDFGCSECGFESKVRALGRGQGHAHNPFFINTGAEERAADLSHYAAHRSAREARLLVRCPRCGARDGAAVRSFWTWAAVKLVAMAAVVAGAAGILFLAEASTGGWLLLTIGAPAAALAFYLLDIGPRWRSVEARVLFDPPRLKHRRSREPTAGAFFETDADALRSRSSGVQ